MAKGHFEGSGYSTKIKVVISQGYFSLAVDTNHSISS